MILNALDGRELPIYGDGGNVRDWLYVDDHCAGIVLAALFGVTGAKYNIGGNNEFTNLQLVNLLCDELERYRPAADNVQLAAAGRSSYAELQRFVTDRPGHDRRYAIDASLIRRELGWAPTHDLASGLAATVQWYLANPAWCDTVLSRGYDRERLGTHA